MLNLFFPKLCAGCDSELVSGEEVICSHCRHHLPLACFHRYGSGALKNKFYGRLGIQYATALLYFNKKNLTQGILHRLKYKSQPDIGILLGDWLGSELAEIPEYRTVDAVIPVPLHQKKLQKRGYNQVAGFAQEVARHLEADYLDQVLIKITSTRSQVFSERITRIFSQEEVFSVKNLDLLEGKHLLLVDDIITTGATLESCAQQLFKAPQVTLSIAAMAVTE